MFSQAVQLLWYANTAVTIALLIQLRLNGLARTYRWFWWFLFVNATDSVLGIAFQRHVLIFARIYMVARSVGVVLSIPLVMDLYKFSLAAHPAIARVGKQWSGYLLAISCTVVAANLFVLPILGPGKSQVMYRFYAFERTADGVVLLFLLLAIGFMLWFPVRISKNVAIFLSGFVIYFMARCLGLLMIGVHRTWTDEVDIALSALIFGCLTAAVFLIRPEGEKVSMVSGYRWDAGDMDRLNQRLTAINTKLSEL